jgi:pilus assembly protein Flp/PilA
MLFIAREETGQGLVEYALILLLVAAVVISIVSILGPQIRDILLQVAEWIQGA